MTTETMLADAYALAHTRRMACADDIALLATVMDTLPDVPTVVQLGAASGTMSLVVYAIRPQCFMVAVDIDQQSLNYQAQALANSTGDPSILEHAQLHSGSKRAGENYRAVNVDLLIVDADHSYEGIKANLMAWMPNMKKEGLIFVHDYDGTTAPESYPGIKKACDEVLGKKYKYKRGWSAVFNARFRKAFADSLNH
ncbi:hypothetical protein LCGC14_1754600 [marine sediment metagenome]|uniref:Methyltransferase domain-containing protein n=1 Tax=marine sediment metagenome TaxID=412755 RepID=A0A0F9HQ87_9ZZZZ